MIVPELADFFLDRGGRPEPRLARLARALRCPGYEVDVRDPDAIALYEVDERGRMRISGARRPAALGGRRSAVASPVVELRPGADDRRDPRPDRGARPGPASALADYLGAIVGFPAWTRDADDPVTAGELVYEPPRIVAGARLAATTAPPPETRAASARTPPRARRSASFESNRQTTSVRCPGSTLTISDATFASTR